MQCEVCGAGYAPDERMDFRGKSVDDLIQDIEGHWDTAQDHLAAVGCILAKLRDMRREGKNIA